MPPLNMELLNECMETFEWGPYADWCYENGMPYYAHLQLGQFYEVHTGDSVSGRLVWADSTWLVFMDVSIHRREVRSISPSSMNSTPGEFIGVPVASARSIIVDNRRASLEYRNSLRDRHD